MNDSCRFLVVTYFIHFIKLLITSEKKVSWGKDL